MTTPDASASLRSISTRHDDEEPRGAEPRTEERALVVAFKRGEKGAYQAIFDRYRPLVLSICRRRLGANDAEEAAQETFIRVHTSLHRFDGAYRLGPWIARIANNVCFDLIRARRRRPVDPTSGEEFEFISTDAAASDPAELSLRAAHASVVRRHIAALPSWHRAAVVMRDYEGRSYLEIADALDLSESQVKSLIHRARKGFKQRWLDTQKAQKVLGAE